MRILGIIPARMSATRFPNKPLASIQGIPMIGHCYLRCKMCSLFDDLYVATCDQAIVDYINSIDGNAVMTSDIHERASERTAEALLKIEEINNIEYDIIVMIQGDEPLVDPEMMNIAINPLLSGQNQVSNLMKALHTQEDVDNPNHVKVVVDVFGNALYMSREPIPSNKKYKGRIDAYRQLGLIAFTRNALLKFVALTPSSLEIIESVDMNRFLENKIPIRMVETKFEADSVDTLEDLVRVEKKMLSDELFKKYKK